MRARITTSSVHLAWTLSSSLSFLPPVLESSPTGQQKINHVVRRRNRSLRVDCREMNEFKPAH